MPAWLAFLLYLAAFVLFLLAAFGITERPRFHWIAAGLACWVFVPLGQAFDKLT
jgi:high-affinity Fe2+/Pb2+ permease